MVSATQAPFFVAPLWQLFNQSLVTGIVPSQWNTAIITPVLKYLTSSYQTERIQTDFSHASLVTPSREAYCMPVHLPVVCQPSTTLNFEDQFAFCPSSSTDAAIITLLHTVRSMLMTSDYVRVFAFDFSKAFDTVRCYTLMTKMATLELPDNIYNWINDFFRDRGHHGQHHSGFRSRPGVVHHHGCRPSLV